jgi:uncharacterized protein YhbP (UPF0306 family)
VNVIERRVLEDYVASGLLMQVATVTDSGNPALCHVWYDYSFRPDRVSFMSRNDRDHSHNIRLNGRIAGGIIAIELTGLGQTVRGVTFKGTARELVTAECEREIASFLQRWPAAESALTPNSPSRLYEVRISEWLLFDEENFPDEPRRIIPGLG